MNEFEKLAMECKNTPMCNKCKYLSPDSGACAFFRFPKEWEIPIINTAMKIDADEPKTKRRKKAE